jgi:hypothetical protein
MEIVLSFESWGWADAYKPERKKALQLPRRTRREVSAAEKKIAQRQSHRNKNSVEVRVGFPLVSRTSSDKESHIWGRRESYL